MNGSGRLGQEPRSSWELRSWTGAPKPPLGMEPKKAQSQASRLELGGHVGRLLCTDGLGLEFVM